MNRTPSTPITPTSPSTRQAQSEGHLLSWLDGRDVKCPVCDYNLRDLKKPVCPECSAPLELAVASPSLNPGPWIASIVSVALGAGFDGVVCVLVTALMILQPPRVPAQWMRAIVMLGTFILLTAACAGVLAWIYRSRRRWAYWSRRRRLVAAWAAFLVTAGVHALAGLGIVRLFS